MPVRMPGSGPAPVISRWSKGRLYGDRRLVAALNGISVRTVRRRCTPVPADELDFDPEGVEMYDTEACEKLLAFVVPRATRAAKPSYDSRQ